MPVIKIDTTNVLDILKNAMEKHGGPDTTVACEYVEEDEDGNVIQPVCIVGHGLFDLGVPLEALAANNHARIGARLVTYYDDPLQQYVEVTPAAKAVLTAVQSSQDERNNWGTAIEDGVMELRYQTNSYEVGTVIPTIPTEPGLYKDKDGDLWWQISISGAPFRNDEDGPADYLPLTKINYEEDNE